jgi:hypothetical protein
MLLKYLNKYHLYDKQPIHFTAKMEAHEILAVVGVALKFRRDNVLNSSAHQQRRHFTAKTEAYEIRIILRREKLKNPNSSNPYYLF